MILSTALPYQFPLMNLASPSTVLAEAAINAAELIVTFMDLDSNVIVIVEMNSF